MSKSQVLIIDKTGVCMLPPLGIVLASVPYYTPLPRRFSGDRSVKLLSTPAIVKQLPLLRK